MTNFTGKIATLIVTATLIGCAASDREERQWTEDVRLEDGGTVQIERFVAFDETNALGGGAYNAVESKATLKFRGELASLPMWDFPRMALVLYRSSETRNWRLVTASTSCEVWRRDGKPRPPYWEYELIEGQWQEVPLSEESIGKRTNLFYRYWADNFGRHVTPKVTEERQSDTRIADFYRSIAADPQAFGCM
jgi:hypothetical protein